MKAQMFQNVPTSISLAIWGTAFMQGRETLERAVDCISDAPRTVSTLLNQESLAIFLSNCRKSGTSALRCHFPRTGNMDFIIGTDEFVDVALELGHVITTRGGEILGIHEEANYWIATKRTKEPVALTSSWQDMDKQLSDLLHETSDEIEAFDLVHGNQDAHDFLIDLEHDISIQAYPDDQPTRVTFLLGRLLRVLAITEFAFENEINSFSATKQSMWSNPILDLNQTCRKGLSAVVNYALEKTS
jgi:hypothetical protein